MHVESGAAVLMRVVVGGTGLDRWGWLKWMRRETQKLKALHVDLFTRL